MHAKGAEDGNDESARRWGRKHEDTASRTAAFVAALSVVSFGVNAPAGVASAVAADDAVASDQGRHKHITYVEVDSDFVDFKHR